jgi:uncharacterized membrane protein YphA (DoxX/SURF4 family)
MRRFALDPPATAKSCVLLSGAIRILVGVVLVYAGLQKLNSPYRFLADFYDYELTSPREGLYIASVMPFFEVIVGSCLVLRVFPAGALLCASGMFTVFLLVELSAIARGLQIDCGCFGHRAEDERINSAAILRTASLMTLAYVGLVTVCLRERDSAQPKNSENLSDASGPITG